MEELLGIFDRHVGQSSVLLVLRRKVCGLIALDFDVARR